MTASKAKKHSKDQKLTGDQKSALIIVVFLVVGAGSFLAGVQTQKLTHSNDHAAVADEEAAAPHEHASRPQYELPANEAVPTVNAHMHLDDKDGYNLFLDVTNFIFAPESAGEMAAAGQGHAHVYVDGVKVARLYGPAYYLDTAGFSPGRHELSVVLTSNDHKDLAKDGQLIESKTTFEVKTTAY